MSTRLLIIDHYLTGKGSTSNTLGLATGDGSLHYTVFGEDDSVLRARTNAGITEDPAGSMVYQASIPAWWAGMVVWDDGAGNKLVAETFDPEPSAGFQGPSQLTVTFVDATLATIPNVTFVIVGVGTAVTAGSGSATISLVDGTYTIAAVPAAGVLWSPASVTVNGNTTKTVYGSAAAGPPPASPTANGSRQIKLHREGIKNANHQSLHGYRLRIAVSFVGVNMDRYVFVYRRQPADPTTGIVLDEWLGVASFPDLAEYPINNPRHDQTLPFFRKDFIEVDVRSQHDADEIWRTVVSMVGSLKAAIDKAEDLVVTETAWFGGGDESEGFSDSAL